MSESTDEKCVFCRIVAGSLPHAKIAANDAVYAFLDVNPISRGHTLAVSREHFSSFASTPAPMVREMASFVVEYARKICKALGADAFNIGINNGIAAGQVIEHAHWHIIPRYRGDGLVSWPSHQVDGQELSRIAEQIRNNI